MTNRVGMEYGGLQVETLMTVSTALKALIPAGSAILAQQALEPFSLSQFERLGTVGIVAVVAYFVVKYLVGQNEKERAANAELQAEYVETIRAMHAEMAAMSERHTTLLLTEIRDSRASRERLTETLSALTRHPAER